MTKRSAQRIRPTSFRLSERHIAALEHLAQTENRNRTQQVAQLIEEGLERRGLQLGDFAEDRQSE